MYFEFSKSILVLSKQKEGKNMQVYNNKKPFINRQILIDLKEMNSAKTLESTITFIHDLYDSKFLCAMLSRGKRGDSEAFSPYLLNCYDEDDTYYLPIFTNELEVLKASKEFEQYTTYLLEFDDILNLFAAINGETPISLVIDPYGTQYTITSSMLKIATETLENADK